MNKKTILFMESRTQTRQWDLVAKYLASKGHIIHWIVCSPVILPEVGNVHIIPFPKSIDLKATTKDYLLEVSLSDRIIKYYKGDDRHYSYYDEQLIQLLEQIDPDIVFGELANFHTHIMAKLCEICHIPFFQPSTARYPNKRFRFFYYDNLLGYEYKKNRDVFLDDRSIVAETVNNILHFKKQPDYMNKLSMMEKYSRSYRALKFKAKLAYYRTMGDKYNIPSPFTSLALKKNAKAVLKKWLPKTKHLSELDPTKKVLLYPVQMQPEFNLDVWGRKFNNQSAVINELSQCLPNDWIILIKLNPKSFLEMTDELLATLDLPNVVGLSVSENMNDTLKKANAVITVTGTVAIECSVKGINVFSLAKTDFIKFPYVQYIDEIKQLSGIDNLLITSKNEQSNIIQYLYENSVLGIIGEEITNPKCNDVDNIALLNLAFDEFLEDFFNE